MVPEPPLGAAGLSEALRALPHAPPFVFVDGLTLLEPGRRVAGFKQVGGGEPWCAGHFPGRPIFPGVLAIEALAQIGGILASASGPRLLDGAQVVLLAVDKVRFRRVVLPGERLDLEVTVLQRRGGAWRVRGEASVDGQRAVQAELLLGRAAGAR